MQFIRKRDSKSNVILQKRPGILIIIYLSFHRYWLLVTGFWSDAAASGNHTSSPDHATAHKCMQVEDEQEEDDASSAPPENLFTECNIVA